MTTRIAFWIAFWTTLLCLPEDLAQAQSPAQSPQDAVRLTPVLYITRIAKDSVPREYARWYAAAERCTGLKGKFKRVLWNTTPRPWSDGSHLGLTYGMWQRGHRVTLNAPEWLDSTLVNHESIHDILSYHQDQYPDSIAHPAVFYTGRCSWTRYQDLHKNDQCYHAGQPGSVSCPPAIKPEGTP